MLQIGLFQSEKNISKQRFCHYITISKIINYISTYNLVQRKIILA